MGEYEPQDSRKVTGAGQQQQGQPGGQQQPGQPQQFQSGSGQMGDDPGADSRGTMHHGARSSASTGRQGDLARRIREHMTVVGADGVRVGTVDAIEGDRIKLTRNGPEGESGAGYGGGHAGHHHYLPLGLVASVDGQIVRLSAKGDVAYGMEEE